MTWRDGSLKSPSSPHLELPLSAHHCLFTASAHLPSPPLVSKVTASSPSPLLGITPPHSVNSTPLVESIAIVATGFRVKFLGGPCPLGAYSFFHFSGGRKRMNSVYCARILKARASCPFSNSIFYILWLKHMGFGILIDSFL
ncbi:hypothetical protein Dimus_025973 [Dionaea muscipula]